MSDERFCDVTSEQVPCDIARFYPLSDLRLCAALNPRPIAEVKNDEKRKAGKGRAHPPCTRIWDGSTVILVLLGSANCDLRPVPPLPAFRFDWNASSQIRTEDVYLRYL